MAFIPWAPLNAGNDGPPPAVEAVAADLDATPSQVALAWLLEHSPVIIPIPGTSKLEHLYENIAASHLALSREHLERLEEVDPPTSE